MTESKPKLYDKLKSALEEGLDELRSNRSVKRYDVQLPAPPEEFDARRVRLTRTALGCSQSAFARVVGVSLKTVQAWEQGIRNPTGSALRLLEMIEADPSYFRRTVAGRTELGARPKRLKPRQSRNAPGKNKATTKERA
jgi:putative transcriptional regulator